MKKFLALVLALVMTMSLVTIGANAKTAYTDDAQITNQEAVEVLSALGVLGGYDDGSFRPQAKLTRGAGAKLIAYLMLGQDAADKLKATYTVFSDVDDSVGLAAYIEWAAAQGIVDGYGDGNFGPKNALTEYAFGKMLLGALGYDSAKEGFTGAGWQKNVYGIAVKIGVFDGTETYGVCDRDTAARMELAALQSYVVVYGDAYVSGDYYWNGHRVTVSGFGGTVKDQVIETYDLLGDFYGVYCDYGVDVFGRPGHTWSYGYWSQFYMDAPVAEYTTAVSVCDVLVDLGYAKTSTATVGAYHVVDGYYDGYHYVSHKGGRCADTIGHQGTLTQVFYDYSSYSYVITEIDTVLAQVKSVQDTTHLKNGKTTLKVWLADRDNLNKGSNEKPVEVIVNADLGYEVDDYVLLNGTQDRNIPDGSVWIPATTDEAGHYEYSWIVDWADTYAYEYAAAQQSAAESRVDRLAIVGEPDVISCAYFSGVATDKSQATVDGTRYSTNDFYVLSEVTELSRENLGYYADFFVDQYGNLIGDVAAYGEYSYGVIADLMWRNDGGLRDAKWAEAELVAADASIDYVNMAWYNGIATSDVSGNNTGDPEYAKVSQYAPNNGAYYTFENSLGVVMYAAYGDEYAVYPMTGDYVEAKKNAGVEQNNPNLVDMSAKVDADTVFLVKTLDAAGSAVYTSYQGIANVPTITLADIVAVRDGSTCSPFVYVDATNAIFAGSSVYAFVTSAQTVYTEIGSTYQYEVYINGVKTTIEVDKTVATATAANLFNGEAGTYKLSYNSDGKVIAAELQKGSTGWTTKHYTLDVTDGSTVLVVDGVGYNIANAKIYRADYVTAAGGGYPQPSDVISVSAIESLSEIDGAGKIVFKLVSGSEYMVETAFVYVQVEG